MLCPAQCVHYMCNFLFRTKLTRNYSASFPTTYPVSKVFLLFPVGHTGLGSAPLWASIVHQDSREAIVWRPEATSVRGWREGTIFLGRIDATFQIRLHSQRTEGRRGDVAIDQLEFLDCALPCQSLRVKSLPPSRYSKLKWQSYVT